MKRIILCMFVCWLLQGCAHRGAMFKATYASATKECESARQAIIDRQGFSEAEDEAMHRQIERRCDVVYAGLDELGEIMKSAAKREASQ